MDWYDGAVSGIAMVPSSESIHVIDKIGNPETANLVDSVCAETQAFLQSQWNLTLAKPCRVTITHDWVDMLESLPNVRLLTKLIPAYRRMFERTWRVVRAFALINLGHQVVIAVKPYVDENTDRSIGQHIFLELGEPQMLKGIICHELTHAFTSHLRLPLWLNEGLAMLAVDQFLGCNTVKPASLELLKDNPQAAFRASYRNLVAQPPELVAAQYAFGYWLTRYVHQQNPDALADILNKPRRNKQLKQRVMTICAASHVDEIYPLLLEAFQGDINHVSTS